MSTQGAQQTRLPDLLDNLWHCVPFDFQDGHRSMSFAAGTQFQTIFVPGQNQGE